MKINHEYSLLFIRCGLNCASYANATITRITDFGFIENIIINDLYLVSVAIDNILEDLENNQITIYCKQV